jgi:hypothetical protein
MTDMHLHIHISHGAKGFKSHGGLPTRKLSKARCCSSAPSLRACEAASITSTRSATFARIKIAPIFTAYIQAQEEEVKVLK